VSDPEVDAHYRPRRRPLVAALAAAGVRPDDIQLVVNCHLHFDHCGGNPELAGRVILAQRVELEAARTAGYTLPALVDAPGLRYEELDGEAEVLPGVLVLPTPGHTPGHQCLAVCRGDGTVVVAGQSHDTATAYGADVLSWRAGRAGHAGHEGHPPALPSPPAWIERIQQLDPAHVVFAHDPRRLGALTLSSRNEPSERRLSAPGRGGGVAGPRRYAGRCRAPRGRARRATLPGGGVEQDHVGHADLPVAQHRFAERVQRGQGRPRVRPDQYRASDRRGS
jgi:N-acyl homoserine lactone hydrolase